jgi:putative transposase
VHCVVPGGGISPDGSRWIACRKDSFFLPYLVLSHRFRKKFLWQLRQAFRHGALRFTGELRSLASTAAFEALCEQAAEMEWVVHVKPPFGGPQRVLKYLARYTHRVAISNHRLRALEDGRVSFEWKDYAHHGRRKIMTLDAVEFMRRFLLHVLPSGLVRIRQFGFLANRFRTEKLELCRHLLGVGERPAPTDSHHGADTDNKKRPPCPICNVGRLVAIEIIQPEPSIVDSS